MIVLVQKTTAAVGLILLLTLVACHKDSLVTPDQPGTELSPTVNNDIAPLLPKTYQLTTNGQATLTYYADGRLKLVLAGSGTTSYRREYAYDDAAHRIDVSTYLGSKMILFDQYYMDEQTGRCHQSEQVDYTLLDQPNPVHTQLNSRWLYLYTPKGQLKSCQNLFLSSLDRTEYTYNADDDLIKTVTYGRVGSQDGVPLHTLTFIYNQLASSRGAVWVDKYPIQSSWVSLPVPNQSIEGQPVPDQYLPIFGKPSRHLLTGVVQTQLPDNQTLFDWHFTYTLNADGYVTERKKIDNRTSSLLETSPYAYLVTTIGVQF